MPLMSLNFVLAQKENPSFTTCKDQSERRANKYMRVIFHNNDVLNDS